MNRFLREYFTYSNRERKGIIVLSGLILFFLIAPLFIPYFIRETTTDFSEFDQAVKSFYANKETGRSESSEAGSSSHDDRKTRLFLFDPNNMTPEEGRMLGMKEYQIKMINKFVSKGGKFRIKEDFKKMYCISELEYERFERYINLPEVLVKPVFSEQKVSTFRSPKEKLLIDINRADSTTLTLLKGIGPAFASRILKFRNKLGGFYDVKQLTEVYGLDSLKFEMIKDNIHLKPEEVNKININTADFSQLKQHPYFPYKIASAIVNYRKAHGTYKSIEELKKLVLVNEELYAKLVNYITVN